VFQTKVGILNAYHATIGDNIYTIILKNHLLARGHKTTLFYNWNIHNPEEVSELDLLIVGGGGIIYDTMLNQPLTEGHKQRMEWIFKCVENAPKKIGISLGFQGLYTEYKNRWLQTLKKLEVITVRDAITLNFLQEENIGAPTILAPDLAWILKIEPSHLKESYKTVTINPETQKINIPTDYIQVPMCKSEEYPTHKPHTSLRKYIEKINRAKLHIAGRLHAFIIGVLCETPTLCLDDEFKIKSQCTLTGYPFVYPMEKLFSPELAQKIDINILKKVKLTAQQKARQHLKILDENLK